MTQFAVDGRPLAVEESPVRLQLDGTGIVLQRRLVVAHLIVRPAASGVVGPIVGLQLDGTGVVLQRRLVIAHAAMRSRAPVEKVAFLGSKLDGAIVVLQGSVQVVTQFAVDGRPLAVEESPVRLQLDGTGIVLQRRLVVAHLIVRPAAP